MNAVLNKWCWERGNFGESFFALFIFGCLGLKKHVTFGTCINGSRRHGMAYGVWDSFDVFLRFWIYLPFRDKHHTLNVVMHAPRDSANIKIKIKYWRIFDFHLKELKDNVGAKNVNGIGGTLGPLILTPFLLVTVFFEYLWLKMFGENTSKYT
ncbi:hypothetical protein [Echinicola sp. 20G]|uniref:hypothetical protein n=1 Tax=Echinicola sp. 20G TaxID=2781961 RepID=UPI001910E0B1|nr:hypothetical protein [Echinicola sp. 20G]